MSRLILFLSLAFVALSARAWADEDLCKLRVASTQIETAANVSLDDAGENPEESGAYENYWQNTTCTAIIVAKKGRDASGLRKASIVYIHNRSMADQKVEVHLLPIESDGSFAVPGVTTCRPEQQVKFIHNKEGLTAHCGIYSLPLKKNK